MWQSPPRNQKESETVCANTKRSKVLWRKLRYLVWSFGQPSRIAEIVKLKNQFLSDFLAISITHLSWAERYVSPCLGFIHIAHPAYLSHASARISSLSHFDSASLHAESPNPVFSLRRDTF